MKDDLNDGGPAFPNPLLSSLGLGLSRREWFATFAPDPTKEQIDFEYERDKNLNIHGDSYKPSRRTHLEILTDLRYKFADAMIVASGRKPRGSE
jgi:hypothetical protein